MAEDNAENGDQSAEKQSAVTRRRMLASGVAGGLVVLAGCSTGEGGTPAPTDTPTATSAADTPTASSVADTLTPTEATTDTPEQPETREQPSGEANIEFSTPELIRQDEWDLSPVYVEFTVENVGDAASGSVFFEVEWFNSDGESYGRRPNLARLFTIGEGEQALIRREPPGARTDPPEEGEITDVEVTLRDAQTAAPTFPDGLQVDSESLTLETDVDVRWEISVSGTAVSTRDVELEPLVARSKVYNPDGVIIGSGLTRPLEDHGSNEDWNFDTNVFQLAQSLTLGHTETITDDVESGDIGELDAFLDTRF